MSNISNPDTAQVLIHALPYIQKYSDKTIVVKYGGNAMVNESLKDAVMTDMVLLSLVGIRIVVVHGGGPEITDMLRRVGKQSRFVNGLRYTDEETMDIVCMVLAGKVNKELVQNLETRGGRALGLCGLDGGMIHAERFQVEEDLGLVGDITSVDVTPINDALGKGYIPVIATMAGGPDGAIYNINADTAAARIAAALGAEKLFLLTDTRGLLRDKDDESTLIPLVNVSEVPNLVRKGIIQGGMIPKVDCCVEAVRRGVHSANIIDGRIPHSILIEMFSDEGIGTMFL
ncbi:MAG: acetylglutamate kinase [Clostridia bacterium]|nr:acetylglutamate kinase [Clostridia bacterium]